jgi:hypothetical protein
MRPSTVPSQLSSVEKVSVAGKNGLVTDWEKPVPENAEDPLPELQVGAADDAAGYSARTEADGCVRSHRAAIREDVEIRGPVEVAPGAAELAADIESTPVGEVLGIGHDDAWNSVGRGICRSERQRDRRRCQPQSEWSNLRRLACQASTGPGSLHPGVGMRCISGHHDAKLLNVVVGGLAN